MAFYITNSDSVVDTDRFIGTKSIDYSDRTVTDASIISLNKFPYIKGYYSKDYSDRTVTDASIISLNKFPYIKGYYSKFNSEIFSSMNKKYTKWYIRGGGE
jgi:hypothetical protein